MPVIAYFRIQGKCPTCSKKASYLGNTSCLFVSDESLKYWLQSVLNSSYSYTYFLWIYCSLYSLFPQRGLPLGKSKD